MPFRPKLVEPLDRCLDCLPPSLMLLVSVNVALATPGKGEAECADHPRQHQALTHQRHQDHGKREEENEITIGEQLTVDSCKRERERCCERDDAADPGEREHEWPLPGR